MERDAGKHLLPGLVLLLTAALITSCGNKGNAGRTTLERIRARGRIVMITQNAGNTYYLYEDQPVGFEYDLAAEFARDLGVELEVVTPGWLEMFDLLEEGEGDFIAAGVTVVPSRERRMDFSDPYMSVRQNIIVHHNDRTVRKVEDLEGRTVHVRAGTSYQERLAQMQGEGLEITLVLVPDVPTEELIRQVAELEIDITVADTNIALMGRIFYPDIRIAFPISQPQDISWAVRKGDEDLLEAINAFIHRIKEDGTFAAIYNRYHGHRDIPARFDLWTFNRRVATRLPRYREIIQETAERHGFDWRLIAAVVYQESHFNPRARSYTGVRGLMQVTLRTAEEMGIDNRLDPRQSVRAGVAYLEHLYERFGDIDNEDDRLRFALAAYNIGYGHVRDAQGIVRRREGDPDSWTSLREALPLLRIPEHYRKTRYGYARGTEAVRYVSNIMIYYDILKNRARPEV